MTKHIPVLMQIAIHYAMDMSGEKPILVDCTLGGGGYSQKILDKNDKVVLYSFDLDRLATDKYVSNLKKIGYHIISSKDNQTYLQKEDRENIVITDNFSNFERHLKAEVVQRIDAVIADLGWSTDQLETIEGLSYEREDAELDMRYSKEVNHVKASDLLNVLDSGGMETLFTSYGELGYKKAKNLTQKIIKVRQKNSIKTVGDFLNILKALHLDSQKIKSQAFQALRIAVNNEYEAITELVKSAYTNLRKGGRLIIVTFHSGEDKILLDAVSEINGFDQKTLDGKPFGRPSVQELKNNLSARSAKLFVFEKNE